MWRVATPVAATRHSPHQSCNVAPMLLGVDVGGTFTDAVLAFDGRARHRQGADHAATTSPRA